jgi:flagellar biosynthesis/type III secretory pathway protein FliH
MLFIFNWLTGDNSKIDKWFNKGYNKGYKEGRERGFSEGTQVGYKSGWKEGLSTAGNHIDKLILHKSKEK